MARDNEQPLIAVDAPARPRVADEWVEYLTDPNRRGLLCRVLEGAAHEWPSGRFQAPREADAVVEKIFNLPTGSGAELRGGFPLRDADERHEKWEQELREADRRGYERGVQDARYESINRAKEVTASTTAPKAVLSRQQHRAAERTVRKANR